MSETHAQRREPATPDAPLDLAAAADELLSEAREQSSGRLARTLTPGQGAGLSQTMLAMTAGTRMDDHRTPGPATIQILRGGASLTVGDAATSLQAGQWHRLPDVTHGLTADDDVVALLTVAPRASTGG